MKSTQTNKLDSNITAFSNDEFVIKQPQLDNKFSNMSYEESQELVNN